MEELINKAKNGDEDAFTTIIITMEKDLYKIARLRLSSEDDINEAVQETIIETFKNLKKLRKVEYFKIWIIKILINKCNHIYKKKKHNGIFIKYDEENINNLKAPDNSEKILEKLDFEILIQSLNYEERTSLTLYYLENLTTKEISKILKKPDSTIRNQISRARKKLKNILESQEKNIRRNML